MIGLVVIESVSTVPAVSWSAGCVSSLCSRTLLHSYCLKSALGVCVSSVHCLFARVTLYTALQMSFRFHQFISWSWFVLLKVSPWLVVCFLAGGEGKRRERRKKEGGKKSYPFDLAGKNMGSTTESHLLCQLFCRRGDIPMGTRFLLCESQADQCGPCLIWPWKQGEMEEVCGGVHLLPSPPLPQGNDHNTWNLLFSAGFFLLHRFPLGLELLATYWARLSQTLFSPLLR